MTLSAPILPLPAPRQTPYGLLRGAAFVGDQDLPAQSEVVIIGGGILGAATAYYLALRKIPVVLCEKAEIACESSSRAFGWITEMELQASIAPILNQSKALWAGLQSEIGETGYRQHGILHLADTEEDLALHQAWLDGARDFAGAGTRMLTSQEVAERLPTASRRFAGGLLSPTDGSIEPIIATAKVAEAARRAGARIVTDCAVRGLDLAAGRVTGVFTEKGYIKTSTVLCAANSWSRLFCGNLGVDVPQLYVIMSMGRTSVTPGPIGSGGQHLWAWRSQIDGGYSLGGVTGVRAPATRDGVKLYKRFAPLMKMMGGAKFDFGRDAWNDLRLARRWDPRKTSPFEMLRVLSGVTAPVAQGSLADNAKVFPEMAAATVAETWSGPLTLTPDGAPILGPVDQIPGFHIATGCAMGLSWGPAIGKAMAADMTGETADFDLKDFRLGRFSDAAASTKDG